MKWVNKNLALLVTIFFAVAFLLLWIFTPKEKNISDLWLNLLAGFIASICTISIFDNITKRQKEESMLPYKIALYRDVQLFIIRIISLWQEMLIESCEFNDNISIEKLFSSECIDAIFAQLDLDGYPNIIPKRNWFVHIDQESKYIIELGNNILNRFITITDPNLIQAIHHTLQDSSFLGKLYLISTVKQLDDRNSIPRCPILFCYLPKPSSIDYEMIRKIISWCNTSYTGLENIKNVFKLPNQVVKINPDNPPQSMISVEKFQEKITAFNEWQKSNPTVE